MNRYWVLVAAVGVAFVAGCSSMGKPTADSDDDKTYVTGSHIPARDSGSVKSTTDKTEIENAMRRGSIYMPSKGSPN
jgi:hypothetical protein